jgi:hypothetical protein
MRVRVDDHCHNVSQRLPHLEVFVHDARHELREDGEPLVRSQAALRLADLGDDAPELLDLVVAVRVRRLVAAGERVSQSTDMY